MARLAYKYFQVDVYAHLLRVHDVPREILPLHAVWAFYKPVLLVALEPVRMHASFRHARVAEGVRLLKLRVLCTCLIVCDDVQFGGVFLVVREPVCGHHDRRFFRPRPSEVNHGGADLLLLDGVFIRDVLKHALIVGDDSVYLSAYEYAHIVVGREGVNDIKFCFFCRVVVAHDFSRAHAHLCRLHNDEVLALVAVYFIQVWMLLEVYRFSFFVFNFIFLYPSVYALFYVEGGIGH